MKIDVRIPFEPGGKLGEDYNRIMEETVHEWVLLLDHDVFLRCNPHWYTLCQQAIQNHEHVGMFTCWTNDIGDTEQKDKTAPEQSVIDSHIHHAQSLYNRHRTHCTDICLASGMFLLVNKKAWKEVGGFPGVGFFREDWDFSERLITHGWRIMRIDGLYVYHLRNRKESTWIPEEKTAKEILEDHIRNKRKKK